MSNIVGFLVSVGRNAAMAQATRAQLLQSMRRDAISPSLRSALLSASVQQMDPVLGDRTMYCSNFPVKTPQPKKAPPKKAPVKAPPKKTPAKPAKKAPAKRR
jgi:hypothetical protein